MSDLTIPDGSVPSLFDPKKTKTKLTKADAVIEVAAKVHDRTLLEKAVDAKIREQREFVAWWDGTVGVNHGAGRGKKKITDRLSFSVDEATAQTHISAMQVSRWRARLKPRNGPARPYNTTPWTAAEDAALHRLVDEGAYTALVARSIPGRSVTAIEGRLTVLALTPRRLTQAARKEIAAQNGTGRHTTAWTPEQDAVFRRMWADGVSIDGIGTALGKSRNAVAARRSRIGLKPRAETDGGRGGAMNASMTPAQRSAAAKRARAVRTANNRGVDPWTGRKPGDGWTGAEHAELVRLAGEGCSGREIARTLGKGRNSVTTRARRTGVRLLGGKSGPPKSGPRDNNPSGITVTRLKAAKSPAPASSKFAKDGRVAHPSLPAPLPSVAAKSIADIEHNQCRYIGDRPEILTIDTPLYCGQPGYPWCAEHRARVMVPVRR